VKAECLQKTGTFKIRGALNRVLCLSPAEKLAGVVAFSSGNFGQASLHYMSVVTLPCPLLFSIYPTTPSLERIYYIYKI
jgi:threonine dehydratase